MRKINISYTFIKNRLCILNGYKYTSLVNSNVDTYFRKVYKSLKKKKTKRNKY